MASFFDRIRDGLSKTARQIRDVLSDAGPQETPAAATATAVPAGTSRPVAIDSIDALEDALIAADVGLAATTRIIASVREERAGTISDRVRRVMLGILNDV